MTGECLGGGDVQPPFGYGDQVEKRRKQRTGVRKVGASISPKLSRVMGGGTDGRKQEEEERNDLALNI